MGKTVGATSIRLLIVKVVFRIYTVRPHSRLDGAGMVKRDNPILGFGEGCTVVESVAGIKAVLPSRIQTLGKGGLIVDNSTAHIIYSTVMNC